MTEEIKTVELEDGALEEVSGGAGISGGANSRALPEGYIHVDTDGACDNYQPRFGVDTQTFNYGRCITCEHLESAFSRQACHCSVNYRR